MKRLIFALVLTLSTFAAAANAPSKAIVQADLVPDVLLTCSNPVEIQTAASEKATSADQTESTSSHETEIAHLVSAGE